jgi:hypothetical protein
MKKPGFIVDTENKYISPRKTSVSKLQSDLTNAKTELIEAQTKYKELVDKYPNDTKAKIATRGKKVGTESTPKGNVAIFEGGELLNKIETLNKKIDDIEEALKKSPYLKWNTKKKDISEAK